jgi:hypothetical protein
MKLFNKENGEQDLGTTNDPVNAASTKTLTMGRADEMASSKPIGGGTIAAAGTREQGELQAVEETHPSEYDESTKLAI